MKNVLSVLKNVGAKIEKTDFNGAFGNDIVNFSYKGARGWVVQDRGYWEIAFDYKHPLPDHVASKHNLNNKSFSSDKEVAENLKAVFQDF